MELILLNAADPGSRRVPLQKIASCAVHILLLGVLTHQFHIVAKARPHPHKTALVLVTYAPGHNAILHPPRPKIIPPMQEPKLAMKQPDPSPPLSDGDPTGKADVTVAMANFYPDPKPDLSVLPHGTNGDIVVNLVIDDEGKVVDTQVDQGLGHGVDEAVMAVLQTWTFTPATKGGKPVASKQQLLFHFERA